MINTLLLAVTAVAAVLAAVFALLGFLGRIKREELLSPGHATSLLRSETEVVRGAISAQASELRQELVQSFATLRDGIDAQVRGFGERLDHGIRSIDDRVAAMAAKQKEDMQHMRTEAETNREGLRGIIESKLDQSATQQADTSRQLRDELGNNFQRLGSRVSDALSETSNVQKERLENVTTALSELAGKLEKAQEGLRLSLEKSLEQMRGDNAEKLEKIRVTVDEQLQGTLEQRLGASFKLVNDQLEQVFRSVGEMQALATGVGDLKRVLTSVKMRGTWGEVSLGNLLEQVMAPEQFAQNVEIKPTSGQRVEYAIKLPGAENGDSPVWLPIDAKFPTEDYERLVDAAERADAEALEQASKALELRIKGAARDICDKYIRPPHSTDFGILFLPTEGLYAEVIRRPGLLDTLQRECRVVVTGPTTLLALLNSLRMGFKTLAIQKRSSEVWQILAAVKSEFGEYGKVMEKVQKKLQEASNSIDQVAVRKRAIDRKLRGVEVIPELQAAAILEIGEQISSDPAASTD